VILIFVAVEAYKNILTPNFSRITVYVLNQWSMKA
jgi:hypothetical protein